VLQAVPDTERTVIFPTRSRTMHRLALTLFAMIAAPASSSELPPDLAETVRRFDRAQVSNDTAILARLVADDYVLVNSDASVQDKEQFLADFHLPGFKLDPYTLQENVAKAWGDAAVTGGLLDLSWTQDGRHQTRLLRIVHVWAKRDGRWQATFTQVTRVP
jgi:ketosteroid isomerase-like protein